MQLNFWYMHDSFGSACRHMLLSGEWLRKRNESPVAGAGRTRTTGTSQYMLQAKEAK